MRSITVRNFRLVVLLILALGIAPTLALAQGVDPASVTASLDPGDSMNVTKTVTTPVISPKPDIVFLSDTTGSMGEAIGNVQANANTILTTVLGDQPDSQFAVAQYKDGDPDICPSDPFAFNLDHAITDNTTDVTTALGTWAAGGGCDTPESQLNALYQLATSASVGFRTDSTRIVVWFGDNPGHDPSLGHTLNDVITALQAANIRVIAVPVDTGGDGLDATGQATAITDATGGVLESSTDPNDVSNAILAGLSNLPVTVTPSVTSVDAGLSVSFVPASQIVTSGDDAVFTETITVANDAPQGTTLSATVDFLLNGESAGADFTETIKIDVNDVTPPVGACDPGTNPSGKKIPAAPGKGGQGQNQDGFYLLSATDNVDPNPQIFVTDTGSGTVFGPFASDTNIKYVQAPGATPGIKEGAGAVDWMITGTGDMQVTAIDSSGNVSDPIDCLVPPPPM